MLKHRKGNIITSLKICNTKVIEPKIVVPDHTSIHNPIRRRTKRERTKKTCGPAFLPEAPCGGEGSVTKQTKA